MSQKGVSGGGNAKLSKDEVIAQLNSQVAFMQNAYKKIQIELGDAKRDEFYKRVDYLFKIIENPGIFLELDVDFVKSVATEIISIIKFEESSDSESDCDNSEPEPNDK